MEDKLLLGAYASNQIHEENKEYVEKLRLEGRRIPKLVNIMIGDSEASKSYLNGIRKACEKILIDYELLNYASDISEQELMGVIHDLNKDETVDGILIQMPLPKHINKQKVIMELDPDKDVDGMHPINVGKLQTGQSSFAPCTAQAVMEMFKAYEIDLKGKQVVVLGRSEVIGKPVAMMCLAQHATVTICHSRSLDIETLTSRADILISAVGQAKMVKHHWVKENAVVMDVGINVDENGKLCGDVDTEDVLDKVCKITPVPRGVGVVTNAVLMKHVLEAYRRRCE